jgi:hypothetical protein
VSPRQERRCYAVGVGAGACAAGSAADGWEVLQVDDLASVGDVRAEPLGRSNELRQDAIENDALMTAAAVDAHLGHQGVG